MLYAELVFKLKKNTPGSREKLLDTVYGLLAALLKNHQIADQQVLGWVNQNLQVAVQVPRPDSLALRHFSSWALSELEKVKLLCSDEPELRVIDDRIRKKYTTWQKEHCFYLFTTFIDISSPVCAGSDGSPIPPYLLPLDEKTKESLHAWQSYYKMYDSLWLRSGSFEIPSYRQMADPLSEHSKKGREICRVIEHATAIPTYYFLHRYWGRRTGEKARLCPLCGKDWVHKRTGNNWRGINRYDFLCPQDRIISKIADSYDDERHARIGEYKKTKASRE